MLPRGTHVNEDIMVLGVSCRAFAKTGVYGVYVCVEEEAKFGELKPQRLLPSIPPPSYSSVRRPTLKNTLACVSQ